jgi:hypothetical protein
MPGKAGALTRGRLGMTEPRPVPRSVWNILASRKQERALAGGLLFMKTSYPLASVDSTKLSPTARESIIEPWRSWEELESATMVRGSTFIDPELGWVICDPAHLVDTSLIDSAFAPRPRLSAYLRARALRHRIRREKAVIHLRSWGEGNYWHFLNDLLGGRLRLAEACGIPDDVPVLIGERAYARPFVRELAERGAFGTRRLLVQGSEYIHADEVVVFGTARSNRQNFDFVLDRLDAPGGDASKRRRIFLSRQDGSGRTISNHRDVATICGEFGFDIVRTERMTVEEQMALFGEAAYLIGIHGAGLVNMMFRRGAPLRVLEIFPPSELLSWGTTPPHYCYMAQAFGFDYDALITSETRRGDYRSPFWLDPTALRERIEAMLT